MAKQPRAADESAPELKDMIAITYMPGEGDPPSIKWRNRTFHANVPKQISDLDHIEAAKGNKHFKVGPFDPDKDKPPSPDFTGTPKTSDEYRAHVVAWLKKLKAANERGEPNVTGIDDMIKQWAAEQHLRELCDVGSDDYSFISQLFLPKMHELQKVAELNDKQLADKWGSYGIFQLPF